VAPREKALPKRTLDWAMTPVVVARTLRRKLRWIIVDVGGNSQCRISRLGSELKDKKMEVFEYTKEGRRQGEVRLQVLCDRKSSVRAGKLHVFETSDGCSAV
jgi:hypothetical protein